MCAPRYRKADDRQTRGPLTAQIQPGRGDVQDLRLTLTDMNNMYDTPSGHGPEDRTQPVGSVDPDARFSPAHSRKKRLLTWAAGVTLAGFLAGGGIALAVTGGTTAAASSGSTASQTQGATLNAELATASSTSASVPLPRIRWALARLRALGGVDGEFTFHNKTGFHTLAFERGVIQSVSGNNVVVKAPDGTTWTWLIVSDTVVRQNGNKTTTSALAANQTVFAGGPIVNGAKDIRLIVIRPAGSGSGSSSSSSSVSGPGGTTVS
jgi:hypothetical protein